MVFIWLGILTIESQTISLTLHGPMKWMVYTHRYYIDMYRHMDKQCSTSFGDGAPIATLMMSWPKSLMVGNNKHINTCDLLEWGTTELNYYYRTKCLFWMHVHLFKVNS